MSQVCKLFVVKEEVLATLDNSDCDLQLAKGQIVLVLNIHNANKMVYVALVTMYATSTTTEVDQTDTIKYYSIAPYTYSICPNNEDQDKDIDHSNEINFQYPVDVKRIRSEAEKPQVQLIKANSYRTLSIPPGSYLRLGESLLKMPFGALVEATGIAKDHGKLCPRQLKVALADSAPVVREDIMAIQKKITKDVKTQKRTGKPKKTEEYKKLEKAKTAEKKAKAAEEINDTAIKLQSELTSRRVIAMKTHVPMPRQAAETNWFEVEEPLIGFTSEIFKEEKTRKQALKTARMKAMREAKKDDKIATPEELKVDISQKQYPRGKFYILSSDFEDLETGQLVLVLSPLLANCARNNVNKKVHVVVITMDDRMKMKHAVDRFKLLPLAPTLSFVGPSDHRVRHRLYVEHFQQLSWLPKDWFLKLEPFPIRVPWEILEPKLLTRSRTMFGYGDDGMKQEKTEKQEVHLTLQWPGLKTIRQEMEKLLDADNEEKEWREKWEREMILKKASDEY
ncbi:ATP-dependent RNA helicase [Venturia nashicola]|uniref:ATP-dependent RNA helicase n=1 Tax=Venturia nashicola TaxID=86259 RepID=A0A4Z1P319_9PEZI|nr:ATP-dependent RNA helicase [Venturia nashicola]